MPNQINTEALLRQAVIDRLIAASLRDVPAREATLARWRLVTQPQSKPVGAVDA